MMATAPQSRGTGRLPLVGLALAVVGVLAGAYAWWRWGSSVLLESVTRICL
jgi:hypothetical protein